MLPVTEGLAFPFRCWHQAATRSIPSAEISRTTSQTVFPVRLFGGSASRTAATVSNAESTSFILAFRAASPLFSPSIASVIASTSTFIAASRVAPNRGIRVAMIAFRGMAIVGVYCSSCDFFTSPFTLMVIVSSTI